MSTYDNGDPMPDVWQGESRPSPFQAPAEPLIPVVTIATAELDSFGTE